MASVLNKLSGLLDKGGPEQQDRTTIPDTFEAAFTETPVTIGSVRLMPQQIHAAYAFVLEDLRCELVYNHLDQYMIQPSVTYEEKVAVIQAIVEELNLQQIGQKVVANRKVIRRVMGKVHGEVKRVLETNTPPGFRFRPDHCHIREQYHRTANIVRALGSKPTLKN